MLADLHKLLGLAERRRPGFRRGLFAWAAVVAGAESLLLFTVMQGLAAQRVGDPPTPPFVGFLVTLGLYIWGQRVLLRYAGDAYILLTRAAVAEIAERLHRLPLRDYEELGRGMLMTRLLGDANRLVGGGRVLVNVTGGALRLAIAFVFIVSLSAQAMAFALFVSLLVMLVAADQLRIMSAGFAEVAGVEASLFDRLRDQLRGAPQIRLHAPRARAIAAAYGGLTRRLRALRTRMWAGNFALRATSNALIAGVLGVNVFVLPLVTQVDAESVREINLALLWLLYSVTALVFLMPLLGESANAAERLQELRERLGEPRLEPVSPPMDRGRFDGFTALALDGLRFAYTSTARPGFAVGPVTVTLRRGELVFVTGHNGSGKSTFLKLLTGLYAAGAGEIRVDGGAIAATDLADYRALFGTIFVDHTLFERVYGLTPADEPRAAALLTELGIADKTEIAGGRVTERDLSTGQKKRLAMALTRLRDRPIVVFDEWAADQDPGFRDYYYQQLLPTLRDAGKLVVVVTHDDQHFGLADRTLHFEHGQLVDRGGAA